MAAESGKTSFRMIIPVPLALAIGALFFMPWLSLSCDPRGLSDLNGSAEMPPGVAESEMMNQPLAIATASGWQLARGEMTLAEDFAKNAEQQPEQSQGLSAKPWVYALLVLPVVLLIAGVCGVAGIATEQGAGKLVMICGALGVALAVCALSIDYVDDMADKAVEKFEAEGGASAPPQARAKMEEQIAQVSERMGKILKTSATPQLWGTLLLYAGAVFCGVGLKGSKPMAAQRPTSTPDHDYSAAQALTEHPETRSGEPIDFGPDINRPSSG